MKVDVIGEGKFKILILHGWINSGRTYFDLARKLENAQVYLPTLPGFGGVRYKYDNYDFILDKYTEEISELIKNNDFDLVVGHSMGSAILLRLLEDIEKSGVKKAILTNPAYMDLEQFKYGAHFAKINTFLFRLKDTLPTPMTRPVLKLLSLISTNRIELIDDLLLNDVYKADSTASARLMKELTFNKVKAKASLDKMGVKVLYSEKDRIIKLKNIEQLKRDMPYAEFKSFGNIGHMSVLENQDMFLEEIKEEIL